MDSTQVAELKEVVGKAKILRNAFGWCHECMGDLEVVDGKWTCKWCACDKVTRAIMVANVQRNEGHACQDCGGAGRIESFTLKPCDACMGTGNGRMTPGLIRLIWRASKRGRRAGRDQPQAGAHGA
jgi:DnaJ-class molecular chaperone